MRFLLYGMLLIGSWYSCYAGTTIVPDRIPTEGIVLPSVNDPSGEFRLLTILLPPGYNPNDQITRYPTIYFLPGLGGDETASSFALQALLDTLLNEQAMIPSILVIIGGDVDNDIPTFDGGKQGCWYVNSVLNGDFETFIIENIIPYIDATYNTRAAAAYRGIMGHSMGGYGSVYLGLRHPDVFSCFAGASPTAFWTLFSTFALRPGFTPEFVVNSWVQPEVPAVGPFAGKIYPTNGELTSFFFSVAGAFSPDLTPTNPFLAAENLRVQLPFLIDATGAPILVGPGPFPVTKPLNPGKGANSTVPQSLVLDNTVVAQWDTFNPYLLAPAAYPTLQYQGIYLDGGDDELADAVSSHYLAELFAENDVDVDYILYQGDHTDCLTTNICSRYKTMMQVLSAQFSQGPVPVTTQTTRLVGVGSITLSGESTWSITDGTFIGIETDPSLTSTTDITISVIDSASLIIGTQHDRGGSLHIGNPWSKPRITTQPSLAAHTITASLLVNGTGALVSIGKQGFVGIGCVLRGKEPEQPQYWGVSSTTNVVSATIDIQNGTFSHQAIGSGLDTESALLAVGAISGSLTWNVSPTAASLHGGGNMVFMPNARLQHPLITTQTATRPPNGIRGFTNETAPAFDYFYQAPNGLMNMFGGSYSNTIGRGILQASFESYSTTVVPPTITGSAQAVFTARSATAVPMQRVQYALIGPREAGTRYAFVSSGQFRRGATSTLTVELPLFTYETLAQTVGIIGAWYEPVQGTYTITEAYAYEGIA